MNDKNALTGIFEVIKDEFRYPGGRDQLAAVQAVNDFRNTRVAHQEKPLNDGTEAKKALKEWIDALVVLWGERFDASYGEDCIVELKEVRAKDDPREDFLLSLGVLLPRVALPPFNDELRALIRKGAEEQIQPLVDYRFGASRARAECREVKQGSLDLLIYVTAAGGGAYMFVKDYDKLRANALLLSADIKKACGKLKRAIEGRVKKLPKNNRPK